MNRLAGKVPQLIHHAIFNEGFCYWIDSRAIAAGDRHSRAQPKPDAAYERIEALREGPYLEMFARAVRPGWDRWGYEADASETGQRRWRANSYPAAPQAAE